MTKISAKRVVRVIEGLVYLYEEGKKTLQKAEKTISTIYRFSHICSKCKHKDWENEFIETEKIIQKFMRG